MKRSIKNYHQHQYPVHILIFLISQLLCATYVAELSRGEVWPYRLTTHRRIIFKLSSIPFHLQYFPAVIIILVRKNGKCITPVTFHLTVVRIFRWWSPWSISTSLIPLKPPNTPFLTIVKSLFFIRSNNPIEVMSAPSSGPAYFARFVRAFTTSST